ncbi:uncharacterized protein LOC135842110 isoform X2 [Planococcus citri]|uniref:uncharacterized protein LOC135842110 isoform X2 n=1 Tax=Planococcus citri TaxID=170843 RepID=UPI0031F94C39
MKKLNRIFSGIVCNISLMTNNLLVNGYNCLYYTTNQIRSVHCKHSEFDDVPQDLDIRIEEIIFENNTFVQMSEKSFIKYSNLTMIKIRNTKYLNKVNPIHKNVFRELHKLIFLSIENTFTEFDASFTLPRSLKKLSLSENIFLESVDLRSATSLSDFYAFDCSLRSFPQFNILAPLTTVDVRWNPMDNWTAESLAPFCLLRNLSVEWGDKAARLTEPKRYCQCLRLENWIKTYKITVQYSLNCTPPANTQDTSDNCSTIYSKETLQQRKECLERYAESEDHPWAFVLLATFFTIPVSAVGFYQLRMQKTNVRKKRAAEHSSEKKKVTKKDNKSITYYFSFAFSYKRT